MSYDKINCVSIGGRDSSLLPGALSDNQEFIYYDTYYNGDSFDKGDAHLISVDSFISDKFKKGGHDSNVNYDFYIGEGGIVSDAYDFSQITDEEKSHVINNIVKEKQSEFPGYEFTMMEGEFPIGLSDSVICGSIKINDPKPIMSTHVLYIKHANLKKPVLKNKNL